ncbi:hypothetical protein KS4_08900 [Poriferisphaera corsica]|uniref:Uncharacterized protein n=1 Tax=Poriferisphaera corsica TaxID=2528020 RepID=A0A517YRK1_9BACT|nr:hypothetical protein KS4_08900 [Poriferisphaera corsica]
MRPLNARLTHPRQQPLQPHPLAKIHQPRPRMLHHLQPHRHLFHHQRHLPRHRHRPPQLIVQQRIYPLSATQYPPRPRRLPSSHHRRNPLHHCSPIPPHSHQRSYLAHRPQKSHHHLVCHHHRLPHRRPHHRYLSQHDLNELKQRSLQHDPRLNLPPQHHHHLLLPPIHARHVLSLLDSHHQSLQPNRTCQILLLLCQISPLLILHHLHRMDHQHYHRHCLYLLFSPQQHALIPDH